MAAVIKFSFFFWGGGGVLGGYGFDFGMGFDWGGGGCCNGGGDWLYLWLKKEGDREDERDNEEER